MLQTAKEGMVKSTSSLEIYGKMQEVFIQMDSIQNVSLSVIVLFLDVSWSLLLPPVLFN
jgi:hypothetical protein